MRTSRSHAICRLAFIVSAFGFAVGAYAHGEKHPENTEPEILAPGYQELTFQAPRAGSYQLPALGLAGDGNVISSDGRSLQLTTLLRDKFVLMSFIYTTCDDINGCPLATYVMSQVAKRIEDDPLLARRVRLLSLSFDPLNDTPAIMQKYGASFRSEDTDWHFLTCKDETTLAPILKSYDQTVAREFDENGTPSGSYSHILRVYLIDTEQRIRNIYSVSFLHAETIINDLRTLVEEQPQTPPTKTRFATGSDLHGPGDNKNGYERSGYETQSEHLPARSGTPQNLLGLADPAPLGLPPVPVPVDNPLTEAKVTLGRKIFFDRRLSLNQTISCAICHVPEQGFTHNELATAVGFEGRTVRRNSPTIYNVAYFTKLFHDARDDKLEHQVWQPLLNRNEMANPSVSAVVNKISHLPDYRGLFEQAFGGEAATLENIGRALASYERTLVSANSAFDRWHFGGDAAAVDAAIERGYELFTGKGQCSACHVIAGDYALFTDNALHNTGVGYARSMRKAPKEPQRVLLAPGVFIDVDPDAVTESAERPPADLGYYEITQDPDDRWKYRTPSLRNIALTAPYMHDGSLPTLRAVIDFYAAGGIQNELLDPLVRPIELSDREREDLVAFLRSLTGDNIDTILSDAFAAPVGNFERSDTR